MRITAGDALGIVEVVGAVAAAAAADAMLKAASVDLVGRVRVGGGRVALTVRGDIASVTAAIGAAVTAATDLGVTATSAILGRPEPEVAAVAAISPRPSLPPPTPPASSTSRRSRPRRNPPAG